MYSDADPLGSLPQPFAIPECYQEIVWESAARSELETWRSSARDGQSSVAEYCATCILPYSILSIYGLDITTAYDATNSLV